MGAKWLPSLALSLLALLSCAPVRADFGPGQRVPNGSAALPFLMWSAGANNGFGQYIPVASLPASALGSQVANTHLAGPASGAAASPTFRALVPLDIPAGLAGAGLTSAAGVLSVTAPVPTGTDTQTLRYSGTAITATSALLNNGTQIGVGVTPTTTDRVSVNPSGTAENGLTVTMPSGATGYGARVLSSTGIVLSGIAANGSFQSNLPAGGNAVINTLTGDVPLISYNGATRLRFGNGGAQMVWGVNNFQLVGTGGTGGSLTIGNGAYTFGGGGGMGWNDGQSLFCNTGNDSGINLAARTASFSSGVQYGQNTTLPISQTATAGYTGIALNVTETTIGSGVKRLLDLQRGSTTQFAVDRAGHLISGGIIPTLTLGANAASATITTGSTDAKGDATVTTTAAPTAATTLISVVYATAYATAPEVHITAYGASAASALLYVSARSTTGFTLTSVNAPPASSAVSFSYMVLQ